MNSTGAVAMTNHNQPNGWHAADIKVGAMAIPPSNRQSSRAAGVPFDDLARPQGRCADATTRPDHRPGAKRRENP